MAENKRPNVVGKGPALTKELIGIFKEISKNTNNISSDIGEKIRTTLDEKGAELEQITRMAYLKTVKAGEVAYDLKEEATALNEAVQSGNEKKAEEMINNMIGELDHFIHKIKTFVVRMT